MKTPCLSLGLFGLVMSLHASAQPLMEEDATAPAVISEKAVALPGAEMSDPAVKASFIAARDAGEQWSHALREYLLSQPELTEEALATAEASFFRENFADYVEVKRKELVHRKELEKWHQSYRVVIPGIDQVRSEVEAGRSGEPLSETENLDLEAYERASEKLLEIEARLPEVSNNKNVEG